ncbi:MAG: Rad52/Rad22 family DNA repair protein [Novosphingobium sp.]|nr:Rad52/Rad22 family DNA repair protein [Novosphingobium sp.]
MTFEEKIQELKKPFSKEYLQFRPQGGIMNWGNRKMVRLLCYVDSRGVQNRLDDVFGSDNWKNEILSINSIKVTKYNKEEEVGGMIHSISIRNDKEEWITKMDGADFSDVEAFKGGISDSLKRAGVMWGIGRYLYDLKKHPELTLVEVFDDKKKVKGEYGVDFSSITTKDNGKNVTYYYQCPDVEKVFPTNVKKVEDEVSTNNVQPKIKIKKEEPKKENTKVVKPEAKKEKIIEKENKTEISENEVFTMDLSEGLTKDEFKSKAIEFLSRNGAYKIESDYVKWLTEKVNKETIKKVKSPNMADIISTGIYLIKKGIF